jgi:hypothetical protein
LSPSKRKRLDSSFGQSGLITTDITGYWEDYLRKIALQSDNKVVGIGYGAWDKNTTAGVMLVRYNANAATGIKPGISRLGTTLTLYPNPSRTHIFLSGLRPDQIAAVQITALDGRVLTTITAPLSTSIPIIAYASGVYILRAFLKTGAANYFRFTITR